MIASFERNYKNKIGEKMKKYLLVLLPILLIASFALTACGPEAPAEETEEAKFEVQDTSRSSVFKNS